MHTMADRQLNMSIEEAKDILRETLDNLCHSPDNGFDSARREASNDMLKYMRVVFPLATKVQSTVLQKHGYSDLGEDLVRFTRLVKEYERHDEELARLNEELRCLILPHMDVVRAPTSTNSPAA